MNNEEHVKFNNAQGKKINERSNKINIYEWIL